MATTTCTLHWKVHSADIPEEPGFYPVLRQVSNFNRESLSLTIQLFNGVFWCNLDGTEYTQEECLVAWGSVMTFRDASLAQHCAFEALRTNR